LREERVETLVESGHVRIERILSRGQCSPDGFWYDQAEDEWVVLLQGAARVQFEDTIDELTAGTVVFIPAHRRHRVAWTDPDVVTIWLAIFYKAAPPGQ